MKIAIVILNWNGRGYAETLLAHIAVQSYRR